MVYPRRRAGLRGFGVAFLAVWPSSGSCFPKDTRALAQIAKEHGCQTRLVDAVVEVNEQQKHRMVDKIVGALGISPNPGSLEGITLGVLGIAFKPNTSDVRESPSLEIIRELRQRGAHVQTYDPEAIEEARRILPEVDYCPDVNSTAEGADLLVLALHYAQQKLTEIVAVRG